MAGIPIGLIIKCLVANKFFIPSEKQGFRFFLVEGVLSSSLSGINLGQT